MAASKVVERLVLGAPHVTIKQYIPALIYGTAWKREATTDLVYQALCNGFTAIDTAAQPKHYREDLVAEGIRRALKEKMVKREDLYLQTKFTSVSGQDPDNMPYDPKATLAEQVDQSVESSLKNFTFETATDNYIDTIVLHSPMNDMRETLEVWQTLEKYVPGDVRNLGISNCNLFTLMELYERASIKPSVVQNRFYANSRYDIGLRKFCREKGIIYQSFWTLTANPSLLKSDPVRKLSQQLQTTPQSALYCMVLGLGNTTILNGTTNAQRMKEDWEAVRKAQEFSESKQQLWTERITQFKMSIGEVR